MTIDLVYKPPWKVLQELGIFEPREIHIEAIAQHCGATIVYETISGSEARILGYGDRAIITVNKNSQLPRQRFSSAHELGHWMCDRGKIAFSCEEKIFRTEWENANPEQRANRYAAELLMPESMFTPQAKNLPITFDSIDILRKTFQVSRTATAIRLVEHGSFPAMIVCNDRNRRRWFIRGPQVPDELWPLGKPGQDSGAFFLLQNPEKTRETFDISADTWINHPESYNYSLREDSLKISPELVVTLLWWKDERQILDLDDEY
ncbi:MAG TPA: hypothetical protein DD706_14365 [Nitrospiraceae bacterium]|nr:hypothetical protein [Nitrospiraceae bacterium]